MDSTTETDGNITRKLPKWAWMLIGAAMGIGFRVLFGLLPDAMLGVMSVAFLIGTPLAVGAFTVATFPAHERGWLEMIVAPWGTILLMMLGCAVTLLEGSICLALMAPLFLLCGSVGGVASGLALHYRDTRGSHLSAIAVLPLLMLVAEIYIPQVDRDLELRREVLVEASPEIIWKQIHSARAIRAEELPLSLTHLIGVPKPLEGVNVQQQDGEIRFSRWERGVHFRAHVTQSEPNRHVSWRYAFDPDSFPPGSMDDHVAIGGRHFDLRDTTFTLTPTADGQTRLAIVAHYRLSTSINAYAVPASRLLGNDFLDTILGLYEYRSEQAQQSVASMPPSAPEQRLARH